MEQPLSEWDWWHRVRHVYKVKGELWKQHTTSWWSTQGSQEPAQSEKAPAQDVDVPLIPTVSMQGQSLAASILIPASGSELSSDPDDSTLETATDLPTSSLQAMSVNIAQVSCHCQG